MTPEHKFTIARVAEEMIIDGQKLIALAARLGKGADMGWVQDELNEMSGRLVAEWHVLAEIMDEVEKMKNSSRV